MGSVSSTTVETASAGAASATSAPASVLGAVASAAQWRLPAPIDGTLALIDFDTQLLPDGLTLPLLWIGLLVAAVFVRRRNRTRIGRMRADFQKDGSESV